MFHCSSLSSNFWAILLRTGKLFVRACPNNLNIFPTAKIAITKRTSTVFLYWFSGFKWYIPDACRWDRPNVAGTQVSTAPRCREPRCYSFGERETSGSSFSDFSAAIPRRSRFFVVFWMTEVAAEVPLVGAAEASAAKWRANCRSDSPDRDLHLGMCIAVYLVALGIPNRVCWSVVLEIPKTIRVMVVCLS